MNRPAGGWLPVGIVLFLLLPSGVMKAAVMSNETAAADAVSGSGNLQTDSNVLSAAGNRSVTDTLSERQTGE
ncbi:MAG: hypothetical protein EA360_02730, partial [Balneolaceae bacterium]